MSELQLRAHFRCSCTTLLSQLYHPSVAAASPFRCSCTALLSQLHRASVAAAPRFRRSCTALPSQLHRTSVAAAPHLCCRCTAILLQLHRPTHCQEGWTELPLNLIIRTNNVTSSNLFINYSTYTSGSLTRFELHGNLMDGRYDRATFTGPLNAR
jgi:hypothetical protein